MTQVDLPDAIDLRSAPELGSVALLDAALVVVEQALRHEHADITAILQTPDPLRPPDALVASLVVERCRELRTLLRLYAAAVGRFSPPSQLPF